MRMGTARCRIGTWLTAVAVLAVGAPAASAVPVSGDLVCSGAWEISLTPPIGLASSEMTFTVPPAALACAGFVGGAPVATTQVKYTETGSAAGSCAGGTGITEFVATVATPSGTRTVRDEFDFWWAGPTGGFSGRSFSGTFSFAPLDGDCVTRPVGRAVIAAAGVLTV